MTIVVAPGKKVLYNHEGTGSILEQGDPIPADADPETFVELGYACTKADYKAAAKALGLATDAKVEVTELKVEVEIEAPDTPADAPAPGEPPPEPTDVVLDPVDPKKSNRDDLIALALHEGVELGEEPGTKAEIADAINAARSS